MRAEFIKVRAMPTPRWCLFAIVLSFLIGLVSVFFWGPGEDTWSVEAAVGLPTMICSIVFGVWMVGSEYGQNTLRRTLTANPRRGRLIVSKILVVVFCVTVVTVLFHLSAMPLYDLAANHKDASVDAGTVRDLGLSSLITNLVYALFGIAFALITASMAGGMTLALIFIFVIDTLVPAIPKVGDYAMGLALSDITGSIRGFGIGLFSNSEATHRVGPAVLIVAAWLLVFLLLGALRFNRSDVK